MKRRRQAKISYEDNLSWTGTCVDRDGAHVRAAVASGLFIRIQLDPDFNIDMLSLEYNGIIIVSHPCGTVEEAKKMAPSFLRRNLPSVVKALEEDIKKMKSAAKQLCPRKISR